MTKLIRTKTATTERLTLHLPGGAITIEVSVRGLELDATTTEWMLHAPLTALAQQIAAAGDVNAIDVAR